MTTTVTVRTHSWPVEVTTTDHYDGQEDVHTVDRVDPYGHRDFYITSNRSLSFKELPEAKTEDGGASGTGAEAAAV